MRKSRMDFAALPKPIKEVLQPMKRVFRSTRAHGFLHPYHLLLVWFALPLVLVQRILSPLVILRTAQVSADRIGNLVLEVETYLADVALGRSPKGTFDIFFYLKPVSNRYIARRWKTMIRVWPLARYVHFLNSLLPGGRRYMFEVRISMERVVQCAELLATQRHFRMSSHDEERARSLLATHGILPKSKYVCFFNRDSAYLQSHIPGMSWGYHDYRDSSIGNYVPAMEALADRGYSSYRVGAAVKEKALSSNPTVIDYSVEYREAVGDDILDVYLVEHAHFVLAATCGLFALSEVLRKDAAIVNATPFLSVGYPGRRNLYIPKLYRIKKDGRLMGFKEILQSPARLFATAMDFENHGIDLVENTADEIRDLVLEMDARLAEQWRDEPGDAELHGAFSALLAAYVPQEYKLPRIGTAFLRKHRGLLA